MQDGLYNRHARYLPKEALGFAIDLGQGDTPLVESRAIGPQAGIADLRFKLEGLNPTGSYKDRFAGLAIGMAQAAGARLCVATSSGNTGAALAAYAAAAGMTCRLYVSDNAPAGKLAQMLAYGADVLRVERFTIDPQESARITDVLAAEAQARGLTLYITAYAHCPLPMEGIKTIAYEIHQQAGHVTDVFAPVGGGGLHVAVSRGFADLVADGRMRQPPRMHVVQPMGNDTVATPLRQGAARARAVTTSTGISGLGVGYDLDGTTAMGHARATGGQGHVVDEDVIRTVQQRLATEEGILVEPAGAVAVAGALEAAARGALGRGGTVVCLLTGHGFKDPATLGGGRMARRITRAEIPASFDPDRTMP